MLPLSNYNSQQKLKSERPIFRFSHKKLKSLRDKHTDSCISMHSDIMKAAEIKKIEIYKIIERPVQVDSKYFEELSECSNRSRE